MEREREVEYLQASLQAADCLRRERRSVFWGQIVPADPRRARPVHLGSLVCRALNSLFTAPLALDTSSPRPRLRHTRREHVQPGHDTRSRDVESTFASIHLHQKHQTKQQQQRTASAEQRANSKQRRAAAMTTPPHATCPSSRPSFETGRDRGQARSGWRHQHGHIVAARRRKPVRPRPPHCAADEA
jgi:hypothetical protein